MPSWFVLGPQGFDAAAPSRHRDRATYSQMKRGDAAVYRFLFVSLMTVVLVAASNGGAAVAASRSFAQVQTAPMVTELPTTATSHPWIAWAPLSNGYVEQEFRFRGMAGIYAYTSAPPPPWDLTLQDVQPYATRMLVRRPSDPAAFNGTVVVEWLNVTNGYDIDPVWGTVAQYLLRSGYAWVGVSAQAAGVEALKKWDPQRYGDLNIVDDGQSYEIFTQAAQALRQPGFPHSRRPADPASHWHGSVAERDAAGAVHQRVPSAGSCL